MSIKPAPTVSIGLPVFNGADFLRETLESILSQTFTDFELVLCDNGSTDGTSDICEEFTNVDNRIVYVRHQKNLGAAVNYNHAFSLARGKYFKWAAHDDLLAPEYLHHCVNALDTHPDYFLAYPRTILIEESGAVKKEYIDRMASDSDDPAERFDAWVSMARCNPVFGLIRREEMAKTVLHGDYMGADRIFLGDLAIRGKSIRVDEPVFLRRIHANMSTKAHSDFLSLTEWFTGKRELGLRFRRWRQAREFFKMIRRNNLPAKTRATCDRIVLRWMWGIRSQLLLETALPLYLNGQKTRLGRWILPNRKRKSRKRS